MVFLPRIAKHSLNWLWMNLFLMCGRCSTTENRDGVYMGLCACVCVCLQCNSMFLYVPAFFVSIYVYIYLSMFLCLSVMQLHIVYTFTWVHVWMQVCGCVSMSVCTCVFWDYAGNMNRKARLDSDSLNVVFCLMLYIIKVRCFKSSLSHKPTTKLL